MYRLVEISQRTFEIAVGQPEISAVVPCSGEGRHKTQRRSVIRNRFWVVSLRLKRTAAAKQGEGKVRCKFKRDIVCADRAIPIPMLRKFIAHLDVRSRCFFTRFGLSD